MINDLCTAALFAAATGSPKHVNAGDVEAAQLWDGHPAGGEPPNSPRRRWDPDGAALDRPRR